MRIEQITFTRFLAAISIVVFHYGKGVYPFNNESIAFIFQQANVGVSYFFALSGFVMIITYQNKGAIKTGQYYKNRFARIYPVYFLALLLFLIYRISYNYSVDYYTILWQVLAIQSWIPSRVLTFNYPAWSLSVEVFFYAIFPLLFNFIYDKKAALKYCALPIVFIFVLSQWLFIGLLHAKGNGVLTASTHNLLHYFPLMHINEFLMGNLAGLFFVHRLKDQVKNYDWPILALTSILIVALKYPVGLNFHNGLLLVVFVPLILLIALNNGIIASASKAKALVFLGEISFGIYILQLPVFKFMGEFCIYYSIQDTSTIFYLSIAVLILMSALSYTFFETPVRKIIRKIKFKRQASTPQYAEKWVG